MIAVSVTASCMVIEQSIKVDLCLQVCVRRGLVAFPSSYLLLHNRTDVHKIRGLFTLSSQVSQYQCPVDVPKLYCLFC